jgi:hypothetical protein
MSTTINFTVDRNIKVRVSKETVCDIEYLWIEFMGEVERNFFCIQAPKIEIEKEGI